MLGAAQVWPKSNCIQIVDWIRGSGNAQLSGNYSIELPFNTSSTLSFRFRGKILDYTGGQFIGGAYTADTFDYRWLANRTNEFIDMGAYRQMTGKKIVLMTLIDRKIGNHYIYDNLAGEYLINGSQLRPSQVPTENNVKIRIPLLEVSVFQAWEGDTLIFDGLPAYNECEDKYGIYDSLGGGFYTSEENIIGPA